MGARAAEIDIGVAFEDVEGGRAVIAFADDDLAGGVVAADDGTGVEFKEGSGDAFEDGERKQILGLYRECFDFGAVFLDELLEEVLAEDFLVGESAGGATDHALAAGDAGGVAHGLVGIEGDGREVALALAGDYVVVADFRTAADAAVAEDAGAVVDVDGGRGVVLGHDGHGALLEPHVRREDAGLGCLGLKLAIAALLLTDARRRVVGEHELVECFADGLDGFGIGVDDHAGLSLEDARCLQGALANIAEADAADTDGGLVLLVAKDGNGDAENASSIED